MCECLSTVNAALAPANARIATAFQMTKDLNVQMRVLVGTEKIDKAKRKPLPSVAAAFCPFCGEKDTTAEAKTGPSGG